MIVITQFDHNELCVPISALTEESVELRPKDLDHTHFIDAAKKECVNEMYSILKSIVALWKKKNISDSFMLLGQDSLQNSHARFSFQAIPYHPTSSWIGKVWQQFLVLWRFTFGGLTKHTEAFLDTYRNLQKQDAQETSQVDNGLSCAFCNRAVIDSQLVLSGSRVQVLYNYAPIGLGGEKLHFLVIPKQHRSRFTDLTLEEHQEAFEISKFVVEHLQKHFRNEGRPLQKLYIYHKTGIEAGQSVPHWHMHLVLTQNAVQDWAGRLTVLRNILLGALFSFKLNSNKLSERQKQYSHILSSDE